MIGIEVRNNSDIFLEASVEKWYNFPGLRFTSKIFDLTLKNTSIGAETFFLCLQMHIKLLTAAVSTVRMDTIGSLGKPVIQSILIF